MQSSSTDTSIAMQRKHYDLMRKLPGWKRIALAFELTRAAREIILTDLERRFPQAAAEEIRRRFIARMLPREDVIRVYGFDPRKEGY